MEIKIEEERGIESIYIYGQGILLHNVVRESLTEKVAF